MIPHLLHSISVTLRPLYIFLPLGTTSVPPHRTQGSGFSAIVFPHYTGATITLLQAKEDLLLRGSERIRPKISMIGVDHCSRKDGKRILRHAEELRPNAICIESAESQGGNRKIVLGILRNPVFLIPHLFYSLIFGITLKGGSSLDLVYAKRAAKKLGVQLYQIDYSDYEMVFSMHIVWTLVSWVMVTVFLLGLAYVILSIPISLPFFMSIFWLFVILFIPLFLLLLHLGVPARNQHMMDRIGNITKSSASKKIFLITGKRHVRDFRERLSAKYDVEDLTGR